MRQSFSFSWDCRVCSTVVITTSRGLGATVILDIALTVLQVEGSVITDIDMISLLRVLSSTFPNFDVAEQETRPGPGVRFPQPDLLEPYLHEFTPFIIRALESQSSGVLAAACRLLDAIGHRAWSKTFTPHGESVTVIGSDLACAVIKRLSSEMESGSVTFTELVESGYREGEAGDDQNGLLRLLGASVYASPPLAPRLLRDSGLEALFVQVVPEIAERIESQKGFEELDLAIAWNLTFLLLRTWSAARPNADPGDARAQSNTAEKSRHNARSLSSIACATTYQPLAMYALSGMQALQASVTNVEMFLLTFQYIEEASLQQPDAARGAQLDIACEALIRKAKAWEKDLRKSTVRHNLTELESLVHAGEKARCVWLPMGHPLRRAGGPAPGPWRIDVPRDGKGTRSADHLVRSDGSGSPLWNTSRAYGPAGPSRTDVNRSEQPQRPDILPRRSALKNPIGPARNGELQAIDTAVQADSSTASESGSPPRRWSPEHLRQVLERMTSKERRGTPSDDVEASPMSPSSMAPTRTAVVGFRERPSAPAFPIPDHILAGPKGEQAFPDGSGGQTRRNRSVTPVSFTAESTLSILRKSAVPNDRTLPKVPDPTPSPGMPEAATTGPVHESTVQDSSDVGRCTPPEGSIEG